MDRRTELLRSAYDLARLPNRAPAREALQLVLAEEPDDAEALTLLAMCQRLDGRASEAHQTITRALEVDPEDPDALVELGWTSYVRDHDRAAGLCADAALEVDPDHTGAWWLRTEWALYTKRFSKAESGARELLRQDPTDADAHAYLGRALLAQGATATAQDALEEALRLNPGHERARTALAGAVVRARGPKIRKSSARVVERLRWLVSRAKHAPPLERFRAIAAAASLLFGVLLLTGESSKAALVVLGAWAFARTVAWLACFGRQDESVAVELDPTFGVAAAAYKTDAGFAMLASDNAPIARETFRAVRVGQEYAPDARCGFLLSAIPEWVALFPFVVAERNWQRAPLAFRRMRAFVAVASVVAFALGVWLAVRGEAWRALLHPILVGVGAALCATSAETERAFATRVLFALSGAFVMLAPLALLARGAPSWVEPTAWMVAFARFLWSAGDLGARSDADTDLDPTSGELWRSV